MSLAIPLAASFLAWAGIVAIVGWMAGPAAATWTALALPALWGVERIWRLLLWGDRTSNDVMRDRHDGEGRPER